MDADKFDTKIFERAGRIREGSRIDGQRGVFDAIINVGHGCCGGQSRRNAIVGTIRLLLRTKTGSIRLIPATNPKRTLKLVEPYRPRRTYNWKTGTGQMEVTNAFLFWKSPFVDPMRIDAKTPNLPCNFYHHIMEQITTGDRRALVTPCLFHQTLPQRFYLSSTPPL